MPSVTLIAPVIHDGEKLGPGDVIRDLTDKAARRLVALGVATAGEVVAIRDERKDPEGNRSITAEQADSIRKMKKPEVLAELAKAGVKADDSEKVADLKDKLTAAWSGAGPGDREELSPEEREEIAGMDRDGLLEMLDAANIETSEKDSDDELRAKLKKAWSENDGAGD